MLPSERSILIRQMLCPLLGSAIYWKLTDVLLLQACGESALNLELMRLIDKEYLLHLWQGVPRMTTWLIKDKGYGINKKRIERLYRIFSD